jgi:uncharacterized protein YlzI (FlbEa/FlbD family)
LAGGKVSVKENEEDVEEIIRKVIKNNKEIKIQKKQKNSV